MLNKSDCDKTIQRQFSDSKQRNGITLVFNGDIEANKAMLLPKQKTDNNISVNYPVELANEGLKDAYGYMSVHDTVLTIKHKKYKMDQIYLLLNKNAPNDKFIQSGFYLGDGDCAVLNTLALADKFYQRS